MNTNRCCMDCATPILECMGFVVAGDFAKATQKGIPFTKVRELCVYCMERRNLVQNYPSLDEVTSTP